MIYNGYSPEILSYIKPTSKVLDVGCATGELSRRLPGCDVTGIDINPGYPEAYTCDLDNTNAVKSILKDTKFDVIACGDVLEHLKNPKELLSALSENLKDGGIIIASIPNAAFISMRLKFLMGDFSYDDCGLMDKTHLRFFNFKTAKELFSGYKIKKIYGVNIVKDKFFFLRPLAKVWPSLWAIHIIVIAEHYI